MLFKKRYAIKTKFTLQPYWSKLKDLGVYITLFAIQQKNQILPFKINFTFNNL